MIDTCTYWCEWAWLGSPDDHVASGVVIDVVGDRISNIKTGVVSAPTNSVRLRGVTLPGMVNGHSHAFHRGLRGRTHAEMGSFWSWRNQMYELADRLTPDSYRTLATAAFAEMVLAGFTTVGEFHYLHHGPCGVPYASPNEMTDVLIEAAATAGIRITLLDTCYLQAGLTPESELNPIQRRFSDGDADRWAERVDATTINAATINATTATANTAKLGAAVHSVRAVPRAAIATIANWSTMHSVPLHAHVSEQPAENEQCLAVHGCTPTELLHDAGALRESFTAVHASHLSQHDLALYEQTGATCCICPTTERDLADGIGPTAALQSAHVPMCIGSDSHAIVDPFEEMRAVEMNQRLATLTRGNHQPAELLASATSVGAQSLGWPDAGHLAAGALADFVTVSLDSPRLAGADHTQLAAALVFGASAADVHHVVVGGRVIVTDAAHVSVNVSKALDTSIRQVWA
jgi:formiminoglutamate deiminase